jgi:thioredoxin 1
MVVSHVLAGPRSGRRRRPHPAGRKKRSCTMSTATIDLTAETFSSTIESNDIVLVDWWASWCGPCRMFAPIFDEAATKHPDLVFAKVDTEAQQELAGAANIRSIPTLMVFRENVLVFSQAGALPAHALDDLISQVKALDMAKVHAAVAERQGD